VLRVASLRRSRAHCIAAEEGETWPSGPFSLGELRSLVLRVASLRRSRAHCIAAEEGDTWPSGPFSLGELRSLVLRGWLHEKHRLLRFFLGGRRPLVLRVASVRRSLSAP
jgi:hypothetical protein